MGRIKLAILLLNLAFSNALICKELGTTLVVTCPAKVKQNGNSKDLILCQGEDRYEFSWWSFSDVKELKPNRIYTFTIIEEKSPWGDDFQRRDIAKIERQGKVIYDREKCSVHRVRMERKKVPIIYGYLSRMPGDPPGRTARRLFPNRYEFGTGGCTYIPGFSPETDLVYVCNDCKHAYEEWKVRTLKTVLNLKQRSSLDGCGSHISLLSDGTFIEVRYTLHEEHTIVISGQYSFESEGKVLRLSPTAAGGEGDLVLHRVRYWGTQYWLPAQDRDRASKIGESNLRRFAWRVAN